MNKSQYKNFIYSQIILILLISYFSPTAAFSEDTLISVPGVKITNGSIEVPGMKIDSSGIKAPGMKIDSSGIRTPGIKIDDSGIEAPGVKIDKSGVRTPGVSINTGASRARTKASNRKSISTGGVFINSNSAGVSFKGKNLIGAIFDGGNFASADFSGANLIGAVFNDANFAGADFSGACMIDVTISEGNFAATEWKGAITSRMTRVGGNYAGANLSDAVSDLSDCSSLGFGQSSSVTTETETKVTTERKFKKSSEIVSALSRKDSKVDLTVNFETDSDQIVAEAHSQILEIANALKSESLKSVELRVEGHTDHDGTDKYNMDLSYRRAVTVANTLSEKYGIPLGRLKVRGFGESMPASSNETNAGKMLNRRVTLVRLN